MRTPLTAKEIVSLTSYLELLRRKKDTVAELDATILPLIQDEAELESDVFESADLQTTLHEHIAQVQFLLTTINTSEPSVTTTPHLTNRQNEQPSSVTGASESHPAVSSAQPLEDIPPVTSDMLPVMSDMLPVVSETLPVASDLSVMGEMPRLPSTALTVPLMQPTFTQPTVTAHVTPSTHTYCFPQLHC